jgi:hypothetical protein
MKENNEIQLVTRPKITHKLQELGANVTKRIQELNIESLVATEDTMKSLKELRADLNKELAGFEDQRKFIKKEIMNPFDEFESVYKIEISEKYNSAINLLKDKIASVETRIKDEKKTKVKAYFEELCLSEKIDFIPFDRLGLDINLSTSEKAYKEKCNEVINRTIDDLNLIKTTEFEAEILTEYKSTLNASLAITTVKTRKEKEKEEKIRLHQIEVNKRIARVKSIGMILDDIMKIYFCSDELFVTSSFIESSTSEEFTNKVIECEEKIKLEKQKTGTQSNIDFTAPVKPTVISAPTIQTKEETVTASFEVTGTMAQLRALGQYMKDNNLIYKNI